MSGIRQVRKRRPGSALRWRAATSSLVVAEAEKRWWPLAGRSPQRRRGTAVAAWRHLLSPVGRLARRLRHGCADEHLLRSTLDL